MGKKILTLLFLSSIVFCANLNAQEEKENKINFTGNLESNGQWYIDDDEIRLDPEEAKERIRSNSYLKLELNKGSFTVGTQLESYAPMALLNYAPEFDGVNFGTVYLRYNNQELGLSVDAGHFYEQFGSGLILRSWEDRQLGINNAIFGGRVKYKFDPLASEVTVLGGKQRIGMGFDLSDGFITGANLNTDLSDLFSFEATRLDIGLSYVGRQENEPINSPKYVHAFSGRFNVAQGNFYAGAEYVYKTKDVLVESIGIFPKIQNPGNAALLNLGYSQRGFGVDVNLRRMENMGFYSQRNLAAGTFNLGVVNYIPAITKQYDYALQNIYVYAAQPHLRPFQDERTKTGEMGGQIDVFYEFKRNSALGGKYGTNITFNGAYWGGLKSDFDYSDPNIPTYTTDFFGFGKKYYRDFGTEIRKKISKDWSTIFSYVNQYYNRAYADDRIGEVNTNTLTAEATYKFGTGQSLRAEAQHQWADAIFYNWWGATLEYNLNYNWSMYVHDIYNYGNKGDEGRKIHYYSAGISYSKNTTRIGVSYGRQRGGLICVGGVCRFVPENAGLTLNISTSF